MNELKGYYLWFFAIFHIFVVYFSIVDCSRKYYVSHEWVARGKAVELCLAKSMQLVSIESNEKNLEILQYLNTLEFWLWEPDPQYMYFVQNKRLFYWTSGVLIGDTWKWISGDQITFFNWVAGNPSNKEYKENCLEVLVPDNENDLLWNGVDCNSKRQFICETLNSINTSLSVFKFSSEKCYYVNHGRLTYHEVTQVCKALSMEMISIRSVNQNLELHRMLQHSDNKKGDAAELKKWTKKDYFLAAPATLKRNTVINPMAPFFKEKPSASVNGRGYINDTHSWPFWSSGNRFADGKTFYWLSGEPIEYFNWQGLGDNGSYCITIYSDWTEIVWENHNPCSFAQSYICENLNFQQRTRRQNVYYDGIEYRNYKSGSLPFHLTKQYYISNEVVTYYRAHNFCQSKGLQLLSIQDNDKNRAIFKELNKRGITRNITYWISANRIYGTNIWEWHGGLTVKYFNWIKSAPKEFQYNANCIEIFQGSKELKWNDSPCEFKKHFICENSYPNVNMYCIRSQEDDVLELGGAY